MTNLQILKRLFNEYTKKYLSQIFLALIFSLILAASTSAIAWLLDPAVEKLFIQKNQNLMLIIPLGIMLLIGVYDDIYRADFKLKFIFQLIAAKIIVDQGVILESLNGFLGIYEITYMLSLIHI